MRTLGPMSRRRPYPFAHAAAELVFAIAAFACGLFDAPLWMAGLAAVGMLAYWSWSRRLVLNRLRGATWMTVSGLGAVAIVAIIAGAYWLGLASGGRI
jgi:hypothetical protein